LRILVVDDNEAIRRGLRLLLSSARADWTVCGEAQNGLEAIDKATSLHPDVAIVDITMPQMDGFQATKTIRRLVPECRIVIISQNDASLVGKQALEVGASGFVSKMELTASLVTTIAGVVKN
jgi:DNA-binding NarL/FixJ family response regulator